LQYVEFITIYLHISVEKTTN